MKFTLRNPFTYWKREAARIDRMRLQYKLLSEIQSALITEVCRAVGYNINSGSNGWTGEVKPLVKHIQDHLDELNTEIDEAQNYLNTSWMRDVSGYGTVRERMERVVAFVDATREEMKQ